ncbi:mitochondrial mRNA pseudouridine synthase Rpusd3-like [Tubulanus polymorphus]|uniref:mitochondrial mRNA pseudouridine synthase Rpusd3-like n=1 Tax=Tubulanus polymorphus TaxID=672921 RepID=UPI003DA1FC71
MLKRVPKFFRIAASRRCHTSGIAEENVNPEPSKGRVKDHWLFASPQYRGINEFVKDIHNLVVFNNKNVLALKKPAGLSCFKPKNEVVRYYNAAEFSFSLNDTLPGVKEMFGLEYLEIPVNLNSPYSGVVLLAKSPDVYKRLRNFYSISIKAQKLFVYKFWVITVGIPIPSAIEERVGVRRAEVEDHVVSVVLDNVSKQVLKIGGGIRPFINMKTLSSNDESGCALIEIQTTAFHWDVLEAYMSSRLTCILGDHKYAPRVTTVLGEPVMKSYQKSPPETQELPKQVLSRLKVRPDLQSDVPLHVHLQQQILPRLKMPGRHYPQRIIEAEPPGIFRCTAQALGLSIPEIKWTPPHIFKPVNKQVDTADPAINIVT